jgi:CAAX prenyl protease-like protein
MSDVDATRPGEGPGIQGARRPLSGRGRAAVSADIIPYVAPIFAYVALGGIEGYLPQVEHRPSPLWYPLAYAAKVLFVGLLACRYRSTWSDLTPFPSLRSLALAISIGLLVTGLWVGLDGLYPALPFLSSQRVAFDPNTIEPLPRWGFVVVRMLGLVILVPLIEELFWRSFLIRWVIDQDFQHVPIGQVSPMAAAVSSVLFALAHPEWLPALATGLLWAWLLWRTKSLGSCVISHTTANLALGMFVIVTGDWKYW